MNQPRFAVVGHPNKGKSSIVSTLSQDSSVKIGPEPGTTTVTRHFPMKVDGVTLYILMDTPGFQRARQAFAWMQKHQTHAANRPQVVADFVEHHRHKQRFEAECRLLTPIIEGAGILYVVDGSHPYGEEYEAEMEILRWSGQPSMALINPIGTADHVEAWQRALGQFFKVVRVFNAMTAEFDKHVELLRAFVQLNEAWREPLNRAVEHLLADRANRQARAAERIAHMLAQMITLKVTREVPLEADLERAKADLSKEYQTRLRNLESECRQGVERVYAHTQLERIEEALPMLGEDLFASESWQLFGLSRKEIISAGLASGAAVGGGIDLALGGASFLLGTALGAAAGGLLAMWSAQRMAKVHVFHKTLGRRVLRCGPNTNPNFPFVVLGRARWHHDLVAQRAHAQRRALDLTAASKASMNPMSDAQRKEFHILFERLHRVADDPSLHGPLTQELGQVIDPLLRTGTAASP